MWNAWSCGNQYWQTCNGTFGHLQQKIRTGNNLVCITVLLVDGNSIYQVVSWTMGSMVKLERDAYVHGLVAINMQHYQMIQTE